MSEYTPTMQQIRDSYRSHDTLQAAAAGFSWEERGEEFDRWLADERAQVWDEGAKWAAVELGAIPDECAAWVASGDNPYRED